MNRRPFLQSLAAGSALLTAGCASSLPITSNQLETADIFKNYQFKGMDLVVEFQDAADVQKVVLYNSTTDEEYDVIEHPPGPARFQVVFPDQMDTYIADSLHVRAKTPNGWAEEWISEIGHANLRKFGYPIW